MAKVKPRLCGKFLAAFTRSEVSLTKEKLFLLEFLFPHVGFPMKRYDHDAVKREIPWDLNTLLD